MHSPTCAHTPVCLLGARTDTHTHKIIIKSTQMPLCSDALPALETLNENASILASHGIKVDTKHVCFTRHGQEYTVSHTRYKWTPEHSRHEVHHKGVGYGCGQVTVQASQFLSQQSG